MTTPKQSNVPLLVGVAIPIVMVLLVAGSIYLPGLFIKPTVDFLYMTDYYDRYACEYVYEVRSGADVHSGSLVRAKSTSYTDPGYVRNDCTPRFYVYDVQTDTSKEYTFEEAQKLKLDPSRVSPDGFEVVRGGRGGDFLFVFDMGGNYDTMYLRGHNVSRRLNMEKGNSGYYYYSDTPTLGWVLP
jgi:hypothetical protein